MGQGCNPFLPSWEYIPDGEPHLFGDRVYLYGSHDRFNAPMFCQNDYVCWSAPADDLTDWHMEGVIYRKNQDPKNRLGVRLLFAPDVTQGPDGRFYLYYAFDLMGIMGVAVSEAPAGPYTFLDHVHYPDGTLWGRRPGDHFPFDPAVLTDEDQRVWLYSGYVGDVPSISTGGKKLKTEGGVVLELEKDMVTIRQEPKLLFPKEGDGAFENHAFFEASSIRRDGDRYIFVYSSQHNHELCYAVSDRPDGGFTFGGTLVDQGDLFLDGNQDINESKGLNYLGNNHGGLLHLGEDWYIFYHRQTNRHSYSRQACAEKLTVNPDGSFQQAEVTSCGLNGGPLPGKGKYGTYIACNLWSKDGVDRVDGSNVKKRLEAHPYFTQTGRDREEDGDQYIANMRDGATAGFKYFQITGAPRVRLELGGFGSGTMQISDTPAFDHPSVIHCNLDGKRTVCKGVLPVSNGVKALYFRYRGNGAIDFHSFELY